MGVKDCNPSDTPMTGDINDESETVEDDALIEWYRSGVGGIGWLVSCTRPDLAYYFSRAGHFLSKPTMGALKALKHVLKYIQGTRNYALSMPLDLTENKFQFWSDSDHASWKVKSNKRRSQTGFVATLNGVPIMWKSTAQPVTALSSTEAEIYAASTAIQYSMHLGYVISELGMTNSAFPRPFTLMVDNAAAQIFIEDTKANSRLKHIDVRQDWVQDMRNRDIVIPEHIPSNDNLADVFTKPLPKPLFKKHVQNMLTTLKNMLTSKY